MWITKVADFIKDKFNFVRAALPTIPPILLICEAAERPGLSAIALTTAIIQRLHEAEILTGVNPCGAPNKIAQFVRIASEEIIREIQDNASVNLAINSGTATVNGYGTAQFEATNLLPIGWKGIIR